MKWLKIEKADIIRVTKQVPPDNRSDIDIRPITLENINDGLTFNTPKQIESFKDFIKQGHKGYYVYMNGECAFRTWIFMTKDRCIVGSDFIYDLPKNEAFSAWSLTNSKYRRKGLFTSALKHIIVDNPDKIISAYVASDNIGSIKGTLSAGFETLERYTLIMLFGYGIKIKTYQIGKGKCWKPTIGRIIKPIQ